METKYTLKTSFIVIGHGILFNGRRVRRQRKSWDEQFGKFACLLFTLYKHDDEANISVVQLFLSFSVLFFCFSFVSLHFFKCNLNNTPSGSTKNGNCIVIMDSTWVKRTCLYPKLFPFRLCTHELNSSKNRYLFVSILK